MPAAQNRSQASGEKAKKPNDIPLKKKKGPPGASSRERKKAICVE